MKLELIRRPSAYVPLVLSVIGVGMVVTHYLLFGIVHEHDEGTPAHIFQLLMVTQVPVIAFFAIKWLPMQPREAIAILALQGGAVVAAVISVLLLT